MSIYYAQQRRDKVLMSDSVYGVFPRDIVITKLFYSLVIHPHFLEDLVVLDKIFGGCVDSIKPNVVPAVKKRVRCMV